MTTLNPERVLLVLEAMALLFGEDRQSKYGNFSEQIFRFSHLALRNDDSRIEWVNQFKKMEQQLIKLQLI